MRPLLPKNEITPLKRMVIATALALVTTSVSAMTGSELLDACESQESVIRTGACSGYIGGFSAGYTWGGARGDSCIHFQTPDGITRKQLEKITITFLYENPARLYESASVLTMDAMKEEFPCPVAQ
jgi:prolipoprotein diacylglyceryltransferase